MRIRTCVLPFFMLILAFASATLDDKEDTSEPVERALPNIIEAPLVCPKGKQPGIQNDCRDEFRTILPTEDSMEDITEEVDEIEGPTSIIIAPIVCKEGEKLTRDNGCKKPFIG